MQKSVPTASAAAVNVQPQQALSQLQSQQQLGQHSAIFYRQPVANQDMTLSSSYAYGFQSADSTQKQEADEEGNIKGSYTSLDANGFSRCYTVLSV